MPSGLKGRLRELSRLSEDFRSLGGLLGIASERKTLLVFSTLFAILSETFGIIPYAITYLLIVKMLSSSLDHSYLLKMALLAVTSVIARYLSFYSSILCSHVAAFQIIHGLRRRVLAHVGDLSMGYFNRRSCGSLSKIIFDDAERIEIFIGHHIPDLISCVAFPTVTAALLMTMDWRLALASLLPIPITVWIWTSALSRMTQESSLARFNDALEAMNGAVVEYIRGMEVIKVFNQSTRTFHRFVDSVLAVKSFNIEYDTQYIFSWALLDAVLDSALLFIFPVAMALFTWSSLDVPVLVLFLILGVSYMKPLRKIVRVRSMLYRISEGLKRLRRIIEEPKPPDATTAILLCDYTVRFEGVSFSYGNNDVLSDIDLEAHEGAVTALVGPSGAGKSTLAALIPRLWDVRAGRITIGGVDIRDVPLRLLMDKTAFVFQDTYIFSDTVHENIAMGRDVSREQVKGAARSAGIHDVIERLPHGYDTLLGRGGEHLSGGEHQRISIARAILKDAPIVVLDEATSFSDPENESRIKEAFSQLMQDKTVIVIAHNLSTITDADRIVVMDEGRIVGMGNHEELLEHQPLYGKMWSFHKAARSWTL